MDQPPPPLLIKPPFLTIMSTQQGYSSWTRVSNYPTGTSCYYPTPSPEDLVPPRRKSTYFQSTLVEFMLTFECPIGQSRVSRSSYNGPAHPPARHTQYPDAPTITPFDALEPSVNVLLGNSGLLSYDVTKPPNTALVFSESQRGYKQISLHKSKQPVLVNPTQRAYALEFEHPTVGRQFISTFEPSGTILSLLSGIYEYFQEKLSAPEFAMLSQMGDVYKEAQTSMWARLGHNRSPCGSSYGVRKVDFLGERVILQGVELDLDGRGRPSVLLIKFTRSG